MTNEQIHNIYLHMSGKAEGIAEVAGVADFPVLFARAILEFNRKEWVDLPLEETDAIIDMFTGDPWTAVEEIKARLKELNT